MTARPSPDRSRTSSAAAPTSPSDHPHHLQCTTSSCVHQLQCYRLDVVGSAGQGPRGLGTRSCWRLGHRPSVEAPRSRRGRWRSQSPWTHDTSRGVCRLPAAKQEKTLQSKPVPQPPACQGLQGSRPCPPEASCFPRPARPFAPAIARTRLLRGSCSSRPCRAAPAPVSVVANRPRYALAQARNSRPPDYPLRVPRLPPTVLGGLALIALPSSTHRRAPPASPAGRRWRAMIGQPRGADLPIRPAVPVPRRAMPGIRGCARRLQEPWIALPRHCLCVTVFMCNPPAAFRGGL